MCKKFLNLIKKNSNSIYDIENLITFDGIPIDILKKCLFIL